MKIIDSNDNEFICRIGSPLNGIKLKRVYVWDDEVKAIDWEDYLKFLEPKFIDKTNIKINKRFSLNNKREQSKVSHKNPYK